MSGAEGRGESHTKIAEAGDMRYKSVTVFDFELAVTTTDKNSTFAHIEFDLPVSTPHGYELEDRVESLRSSARYRG